MLLVQALAKQYSVNVLYFLWNISKLIKLTFEARTKQILWNSI